MRYDKPECNPDNLAVFSLPEFTNSANLPPPHPYLPPEGEISPSEGGIQDS